MKNWLCSRCKTSVQSEKIPNNSNSCIDRQFHDWRDLGECGNDLYKCSKCKTEIYSKHHPPNLSNSCINLKDHDWELISKASQNSNYQEKAKPTGEIYPQRKESIPQTLENKHDNRSDDRISREEYEKEKEKRRRLEEQEYKEWLQNQPCAFCGTINHLIEVEQYKYFKLIAHRHCMDKYLETPKGQAHLAEINKEIDEENRGAALKIKAIEENIRKQEEEKQQEIEKEKQMYEKLDRKLKNISLIRFLIVPLFSIAVLEIFNISIFPAVANIVALISLKSIFTIGRIISIVIEYGIYFFLTRILENKLYIYFEMGYSTDKTMVIKAIIINSISFVIIVFLIRLFLMFSLKI
jgi:hypothetical protein